MISRVLILFSIFAAVSCASFLNFAMEEWELFKIQYGKTYTGVEEEFRKKIFFDNKHKIATHNQLYIQGKKSYSLKMNKYGDMSPNEFVRTMNGLKGLNVTELEGHRPMHAASFIEPDNDVGLPESVDWRKKGAVTPIKDQKECGSCWAFSAVASLEGQHYRQTGKLVSLSEQQLVDCSTSFGNGGCDGGNMDFAYRYIKYNKGIDTEKSYPYKGVDESCHFDSNSIGATDKGFVDIERGNEESLKKAVATVGPISVAIDASRNSFQLYHTGVYYEESCNPSSLDHGVTVVGYGTTDDGEDYWLVKNSWGKSWGMEGYIAMARNRDNNCGIASDASYPLV